MIEFPLGEDALRIIIENRVEYVTAFLKFFTFLGEDEGYILIITFVYMLYDKKLAVRLAFIVLATMAINHLLKMFIGNPRPFVAKGTFMDKWPLSADYARELATEFSTPSGHAMSSFSFYGYVYHIFHSFYFRIIAVLAIVFIGISRPYLGVHYLEDIALGWVFGFGIIVLAIKYAARMEHLWRGLNLLSQIGIIVGISLATWVVTLYIKGWDISAQPLPFVGHLGFILGVLLGARLEQKTLNFNPRSKKLGIKILRWILTVILVMMPLLLLERVSFTYFPDPTYSTHLFHYLCYALAGFLGIYVSPLLFLKLKLIE